MKLGVNPSSASLWSRAPYLPSSHLASPKDTKEKFGFSFLGKKAKPCSDRVECQSDPTKIMKVCRLRKRETSVPVFLVLWKRDSGRPSTVPKTCPSIHDHESRSRSESISARRSGWVKGNWIGFWNLEVEAIWLWPSKTVPVRRILQTPSPSLGADV